MENLRFKDGQEVRTIFWADSVGGLQAGRNGITRITVVMENGQMAGVPWFAAWKGDTIAFKYNGAMVEGVEL